MSTPTGDELAADLAPEIRSLEDDLARFALTNSEAADMLQWTMNAVEHGNPPTKLDMAASILLTLGVDVGSNNPNDDIGPNTVAIHMAYRLAQAANQVRDLAWAYTDAQHLTPETITNPLPE